MSSNNNNNPNEFITLAYLKNELGITNNEQNDRLNHIIFDANQEVDSRIAPFIGEIPLKPGTYFWRQAQKCAATYARALWLERNFQVDLYNKTMPLFETKMETLIKSLKAERNTRTKTVMVNRGLQDETLRLPSQRDTFVLD